MKYMIVAYDENRVIGGNNAIPWQGLVPADMKHFRELTAGNTIIMGRNTFDSIWRPLPNRQNIVISRTQQSIAGVTVVSSLAEAYALAERNIFIIGGTQIYHLALKDVDILYATEIHTATHGDIVFPALGDDWQETAREDHMADEKNKVNYSFVTYTRRQSVL